MSTRPICNTCAFRSVECKDMLSANTALHASGDSVGFWAPHESTSCRPRRSRDVFSCGPQLSGSVAMIDMAHGWANRTDPSDLWRNRCVNHPYLLMCTQGKSEGLGDWQ